MHRSGAGAGGAAVVPVVHPDGRGADAPDGGEGEDEDGETAEGGARDDGEAAGGPRGRRLAGQAPQQGGEQDGDTDSGRQQQRHQVDSVRQADLEQEVHDTGQAASGRRRQTG